MPLQVSKSTLDLQFINNDQSAVYTKKGITYYVNANSGVDTRSGKSWRKAFLTMSKAFSVIASGDTICFVGKIREQLVTPVQVFDVTVIGSGNRLGHADSTPSGGQLAANTWSPPASGAVVGKATVRVLQQGWKFNNILFTMESATVAGVEIVRDAAAGDSERDASHTVVSGCRFAGAGIGVRCGVAALFTEIPNDVEVVGSLFMDTTTAISGAIQGADWLVHQNYFRRNTNHIVAQFAGAHIVENIFSDHTTQSIDLNGGTGKNIITKNYLSGTFSEAGGYRKANANDEWAGNFNTLAGGITVADPA